MLSIASRTAVGTGVLLIMPLSLWISGWYWQPVQSIKWLNVLFWLTETATNPWGIITHMILCTWFLWCLHLRLRTAIMLFLILNCVILVGQGMKSWIKENIHELRPFIIWIGKMNHISTNEFYSLKYRARKQIVKKQLSKQRNIPIFLRQHWQREIGFTCPSGHTIFATSWALLSIALLWPQKRVITIAILLIWSIGVMSSRLLLGMHWPRDLIVAILISYLLVILSGWFIQHLCEMSTLSILYKDKRRLLKQNKQ